LLSPRPWLDGFERGALLRIAYYRAAQSLGIVGKNAQIFFGARTANVPACSIEVGRCASSPH
jgi:hypothetical protein